MTDQSLNTRYSLVYLTIFILALMAFIFSPNKDLDLYRYFNEVVPNVASQDLSLYITERIENYSDFMYEVTCVIAYKNGLSLSLVNSFFVGMYYLLIFKIVRLYIRLHNIHLSHQEETYIIFFSFFSVLPILSFSISRMLASIDMIYLGIYLSLNKKYLFALLFYLLSLLCHYGSIVFFLSLFVGFVFYKFQFNNLVHSLFLRYILFVCLGLLFFKSSGVLSEIQTQILGAEILASRYQNSEYFTSAHLENIIDRKVLYLVAGELFLTFILLEEIVYLKKEKIVANVGIAIYLIYCFFMGSMAFLGDRIMMFIPFFNGISMSQIVYNKKVIGRNPVRLYLYMMIGILMSLWCFYVERAPFFLL